MSEVQVLAPREVPLGGVRALTVRRTLPHRQRSFVGAWCFADHYGPDPVGADNEGGMDVPPHPHCGLSTVSWLFEGTVEHRDSDGVVATVRPGEVNLMTAGHGIAHSEVSTPETTTLHGVQLWVVPPRDARDGVRDFQHHAPAEAPLPGGGGTARVFVGELVGESSPVRTHTPLVGAQLDLDPGADVTLELDASFEHAYLLDSGELTVDGTAVVRAAMAIVEVGADRVRLAAGPEGARLLLLGGTPFTEEVVMWWNFIATDHDGIARAREQWQARDDRFGEVEGYRGETAWLPAPQLPPVRLKPRRIHREPPAAS